MQIPSHKYGGGGSIPPLAAISELSKLAERLLF